VDENGMEWMYANCSSTAQRGALDWAPRFKKAVAPLFKQLYQRVKDGTETRRVIKSLGRPDYQTVLHKELEALGNKEIWQAGRAVRALRPKESARKGAAKAKGTGGREV
jgi:ketol-acid reductoisomerase